MPSAAELEYIYNGLSFGQGSDDNPQWIVLVADGLIGDEEYRYESVPKGGQDGEWAYAGLRGARHIILSGQYYSTNGLSGAADDFFNTFIPAFEPQASPIDLQFNWPGVGPKKIACIPVRAPHFDKDQLFSMGVTTWTVELVAEDPTIEDDV
jgi:hypothetical protein